MRCAARCPQTIVCLDDLWLGTPAGTMPAAQAACAAAMHQALPFWHPAAVVADAPAGSVLARFLIAHLGPPAVTSGQVLAWRTD